MFALNLEEFVIDVPVPFTLLLDDVFSELDKSRQNALIDSLNHDYQTIITTASISELDNKILDNALIIKLDKRSE